MAIRHSLAGQHCKSKATRNLNLILALICSVAVIGGVGVGVFMARGFTILGCVSLIATAGAIWLAMRLLDKPIDKMAKERLAYWRGGQVEELVAWLLEDLSDEWHIFNGLMLKDGSDIDHVVIGPGGVFAISTKSQRGLFTESDDGRIFCNLKPTGFINQVWDQAKQLKDRLTAFLINDVPWVNAVLAVPFAWVDFASIRKDVWVVHQDNIADCFQSCQQKLSPKEIKQLVELLKQMLQDGRKFYRPPKTTPKPAIAPHSIEK